MNIGYTKAEEEFNKERPHKQIKTSQGGPYVVLANNTQIFVQPASDRTKTELVNQKRLLSLPKSYYTTKQLRAYHPRFNRSQFQFKESNLLALKHNPFHHNKSTVSIEFSFLFWEDSDSKLAQKLLQPVRYVDRLIIESAPWNSWGLSFLTKRYQFRLKHLHIQIQSDFGYFKKLTKKLSYFRSLESLRLCLELYNLPNPESYCRYFQSLTNLKSLCLESTKRTVILIDFATEAIKYLPKLEVFVVSLTKLDHHTRRKNPEEKPVQDDVLSQFSASLAKLTRLQQLVISFTESSCKKAEIASLMKAISKLSFLEKLHLSFPKLEIEGAEYSSLSDYLSLSEGIQELKLNFSQWKENRKVHNFFHNYFKFKTLKTFDLNLMRSPLTSQAFLDEFVELAKTNFTNCLNKLSLTLSLRNATSSEFSKFCKGLSRFKDLQTLHLNIEPADNLFVEKSSSLAETLRNLTRLTSLDLEFSSIKDTNIEELIDIAGSIGSLSELGTLRLKFQLMNLTASPAQGLLTALKKSFSSLTLLENFSFQCDSSIVFPSETISEFVVGLQDQEKLKTARILFGKCQLQVEDFQQVLRTVNCWKELTQLNISFDSEFIDEKTAIGIPERLAGNQFLENISVEIRNGKIDYDTANKIIIEAKKFLYFVPRLMFSFAALSRANARDSRTLKVLEQYLQNQKGKQIPETWKIYI